MAFRTHSQLFGYGITVVEGTLPVEIWTLKGCLPYLHAFHGLPGPRKLVPPPL